MNQNSSSSYFPIRSPTPTRPNYSKLLFENPKQTIFGLARNPSASYKKLQKLCINDSSLVFVHKLREKKIIIAKQTTVTPTAKITESSSIPLLAQLKIQNLSRNDSPFVGLKVTPEYSQRVKSNVAFKEPKTILTNAIPEGLLSNRPKTVNKRTDSRMFKRNPMYLNGRARMLSRQEIRKLSVKRRESKAIQAEDDYDICGWEI